MAISRCDPHRQRRVRAGRGLYERWRQQRVVSKNLLEYPADERFVGNEADDFGRTVAAIEHRTPDHGGECAISLNDCDRWTGEVLRVLQTRFDRLDQPGANAGRELRASGFELQIRSGDGEGGKRPVCATATRLAG